MIDPVTRYVVRWHAGGEPRQDVIDRHADAMAFYFRLKDDPSASVVRLIKQRQAADGWRDWATVGARETTAA
jgi:hypothetical protein